VRPQTCHTISMQEQELRLWQHKKFLRNFLPMGNRGTSDVLHVRALGEI
jgi:hypothetical protein